MSPVQIPQEQGGRSFPLAIKAGVELRRLLNLITGREDRSQRMVSVIARRSIDSENRVSRRLPHGASCLAHRVTRLFHKGINSQLHLHRLKAIGEVRQALKLRVGNREISPFGVAHCAKFFLAEGFQKRPAGLAQLAPDEIGRRDLVQHNVKHSTFGIQLRLKDPAIPVGNEPIARASAFGTCKAG